MNKRNTVFVISGASGSGKSTRVGILLEFLKRHFIPEPYLYNGTLIGYKFDNRFVTIGRYDKNGVWKGIDSLGIRGNPFSTFEEIGNLLASIAKKYSMIYESSWMGLRERNRILFYENVYKVDIDYFSKVYTFDNLEQMSERLSGRGRKVELVQNSASVRNNRHLYKFIDKMIGEIALTKWPERYIIERADPYEPEHLVGLEVVKRIFPDLTDEYLKFGVNYLERKEKEVEEKSLNRFFG